jgi:hypothetical protein
MEERNLKQMPSGISDFRQIITGNYAYVDKTPFIEKMERERNRSKFITRPHGFGKSLFLSMLESYYDIKQKDDFEQLFGDLYIGKYPTSERNLYAVLKFDFSGIDSENFKESFSQNVRETVCNFLDKYRDYIPEFEQKKQGIENDFDGLSVMDTAISIIRSNDKMRICLLVDEYDHFARRPIASGKYFDAYKEAINFYRRIKSAISNCDVYRTFVTGVTHAVWHEATYTMPENVGKYFGYNEIMGFTEEELQYLSIETTDRILNHYDKNEAERRYGGYKFNANVNNTVHNPAMVIDFLQYKREHFRSLDIVNESLTANYSLLEDLLQNEKNCKTILEISKHNKIDWYSEHTFSREGITDEIHLIPLLLCLGLLIVDKREGTRCFLKTPNYFARCILNHFVYAKRNSEHPEKIIFLDIDGVLQPDDAEERFKHLKEVDEFNSKLFDKYGVNYSEYNYYDVLAVYYDWDKDAVAELKRILDTTGAKIVISSGWRNKTIDRMVDLCRIHGLDEYIIGATTKEDIRHIIDASPKYQKMHSFRAIEISLYVETHPEIKKYVAIDDIHLTVDLGEEHTVITDDKMTTDDANKCIELLMG